MDVLKKVPVREQDPKVRAANFEEVCLGYNREEAMEEASQVADGGRRRRRPEWAEDKISVFCTSKNYQKSIKSIEKRCT